MRCGFFFIGALLILSHLRGADIDVTQPLHIQQLLPRKVLLSTLPIDPALPKDFVALSPEEKMSFSDWVYWGPEEVLKA